MGIDNLIKDCLGIIKSNKLASFRTQKQQNIDGFEVSVEISIYPERLTLLRSQNMQVPQVAQVVKDAKKPD